MVIFMEQFIISISQEFGSLGHEIAEHLTRSEAIYMIRKKKAGDERSITIHTVITNGVIPEIMI